MAWALSCGASPGSSHKQTEYHMSYYMLLGKNSLDDSFFFFLPQCLLRSSVHPYPTPGAGELTARVAEHTQSVQDQRHLLLVLCHGALHQRPRHSDGDSEGQARSTLSTVSLHLDPLLLYFLSDSDDSDYSSDYGTPIIVYSLVMAVSLADMSSFKS